MAQSFTAVADYLTRSSRNDMDKVRAIFRWIASVDVSALQYRTVELPVSGTPLDYLLKINWKMGNHANFTAQLARYHVNINIFIIMDVIFTNESKIRCNHYLHY